MADQDALDRLCAPGRGMARRAAALSVLAALVWPAQAGIVAQALGGLLTGAPVAVVPVAGGFVALGLLRAALVFCADRAAQDGAETVIALARARIVAAEARRAMPSPWGGAGSIAALASVKLDLLAPYLQRYAPARARVGVLPAILLLLVMAQFWAAGLALLVAGPLIPVFMALVGLAAAEASRRHLAETGSLNDLLVERLSALPDIRLLGAGDRVVADFAATADGLRARTMAVLRIAFLSSTVLELFAAIGIALVAVLTGFALLGEIGFGTWGGPLSPAAGIFVLLVTPDYFQPMRDLAAAWHDRAAARAVADEVAAWEDSKTPDRPGTGGRTTPLPGPATILLTGCRSPDGRALPEISIAPGDTVALVGPSGAGKTTVLRLIAGLHPAVPGTVTVAGVALDNSSADAWRARLGAMPQAPQFTAASLRANLAAGRTGDPAAALRDAAVTDVIAALPAGLNTRLGESGAGLSGGEARRLTLARAIFGHPDIILADEPTADLDAETAARVTEGLLAQAARGATLIVATHDPALAARMNRVIRL